MTYRHLLIIKQIFFFLLLAMPVIANAQQTLNGEIRLSNGFADSDMDVVIEVLAIDSNGEVADFFVDEVVVAANTGSVSYQVSNIVGDRFVVRYLCLNNSCGRFVRERYLTQNGEDFVFSQDAVLNNNQLPSVHNFNMVVGNTFSGTVFFPRSLSDRELTVFPAVQFSFGTPRPSVVFDQFFTEGLTVPIGARELPFTIRGLPPVQNFRFFPFSVCVNCEPNFAREGFEAAVVVPERGPPPTDDVQFANSFPTNQNTTGVQLFHEFGAAGDPGPNSAGAIPPILNLLLNEN